MTDTPCLHLPAPLAVSYHRDLPRFEPHAHDASELVVAMRGRAIHLVNGRSYPVRTGDVYVINPGTVHGIEDSSTLEECLVAFREDVLLSLGSQVRTLSAFHTLFVLAPTNPAAGFDCRLHLRPPDLRSTLALIARLAAELRERRSGYEAMARALFAELVVVLCRAYVAPEAPTPPVRGVAQIAQVAAFIEANLGRPLDLDGLCAASSLSRRHLTRLFRQAYGRSPMDYVAERRLQHAMALMANTGLGITRIAFESGFDDSNYFSRCFRARTGMTPSAFRATIIATGRNGLG